MAIYSLGISNSRDVRKNNVKASEHHNYIERAEKYSPDFSIEKNNYSAESHLEYVQRQKAFSNNEQYEDFVCSENKNMPEWAKENPNYFWECSEKYERANGRTYTEFLISLPYELSDEDNKKLVDTFCEDTFGESFVYSYGIHSKPSSEEGIQNVHAHIMFCERKLDGIERNPEQFFKRYNAKYPERGGAEKDRYWHDIKMFSIIRNSWENILNKELEKRNIDKVSCKSLEVQRLEAKKEGDILKEEFFNRPPVNCDGKILMKLNKYGINHLTKLEKEKYQLYLLSKELKKVHLEEYKQKLAEKNKIKVEEIKLETKDIILDRARYSVYETEKNNETLNEFNQFERQKEAMTENLLGMDIIFMKTSIPEKRNIEDKVLKNFNYKEDNYVKNFQNDYSELKHSNFNFDLDELRKLPRYCNEFFTNLEKLKQKELELVTKYKDESSDTDIHYSLKAINKINTSNLNKNEKDVAELFKKIYSEATSLQDKLIHYDENKQENKSLFKKIFKNNLKKETKEEIQEKLFTIKKDLKEQIKNFAIFYPRLYEEFFRNKIFEIKNDKDINSEIYSIQKEKFNDFYSEYQRLDKEIRVNKAAHMYALKLLEENQKLLDRDKEENSKLSIIKEIIKEKKIEKNQEFSKNIINKEEEKIIFKKDLYSYISLAADLEKNKKLRETYHSILKNKEKLKQIASKKNVSILKIMEGYSRSNTELMKEFSKKMPKFEYTEEQLSSKLKEFSSEEKKNIFNEIFENIENKKKHLFAKLDNQDLDSNEKNKIFTDISLLKFQNECLHKFFKVEIKVEKKNEKEIVKDASINKESLIKIKENEFEEKSNTKNSKNVTTKKKSLIVSKKALRKEDLDKAKGKGIYDNTSIKKKKKSKDWEDYIKGTENDIY